MSRCFIILSACIALVISSLNAQVDSSRALNDSVPATAGIDTTAASLPIIAGQLPEIIEPRDVPYLVTADIVVPPGATVTIKPGVRFLFKSFTGLQVHGILLAHGTVDKPITFTSEHDKKAGSVTSQDPAPYDWNGITITENAVGTTFENCRISYSLFGINALTQYVTIKECAFRQNGKAHVTIKGNKEPVTSGTKFTYQPLGEQRPAPQAIPAPPRTPPQKIVLRTVSAVLVAAGLGAGVWKYLEFKKADADFWKVNDASNPENLRNSDIINDWQNTKTAREGDLIGIAVGLGTAVLGGAGFTVTLF